MSPGSLQNYESGELLVIVQELWFDKVNDAENAQIGAVIKFLRDGQIQAAGLSTTPVADANLSANVALRNVNNNFSTTQKVPSLEVNGANSIVTLYDPNSPVNQKFWRILSYSNGNLYLELLNDAANTIIQQFRFAPDGVFYTPALNSTGNIIGGYLVQCSHVEASAHLRAVTGVYAGTAFYEAGRATPQGYWQDQPFNAGNFYADSPIVFGAAAGMVAGHCPYNRYTLIGKTCIWTCSVAAAPCGGTQPAANLGSGLYINLPGGLTSNSQGVANFAFYDGGGYIPGTVSVEPGNSRVKLQHYNATSVIIGTIYFKFTITFDVN